MILSNVALVMFTVLLMQLVAAGSWTIGHWALGLPRTPALHWFGGALLGAASMALVLLRSELPLWLDLPLSNFLLVASTAAMARGMRCFLGQPLRDGETRLVLLLQAAVCLASAPLVERGGIEATGAVTSAAVGWLFARAAWDAQRGLRTEFDRRIAWALSLPLLLLGGMAFMRLAAVLRGGTPGLHVDSLQHIALSLTYLVAMASLHLSMAAMVVLRLVASLRRLSSRDPLTGLANRGEFMNQLTMAQRWLGRFGSPYSVLLLDIDHFKRVNDTWGHPAGDAVLVGLAQLLSATLRGVDIPARLGGEEFAVLLPGTAAPQAQVVAERLRVALAGTCFDWKDQEIAVTVSIGVCTATEVGEALAALLERGDAALYAAKDGGRNRVVAAPLRAVAEPALSPA